MTAPATPQGTSTVTRPLTGFSVQTVIPGQVNLINPNGLALNYWDGDGTSLTKNDSVIDGGDGTWRKAGMASTSNWTGADGIQNAPWADEQFAIFTGAPGTVTVNLDQGAVKTSGMQFMVGGYSVVGNTGADVLTLVDSTGTPGYAVIRVGDGTTTASSGMVATIDAELTGAVGLRKSDQGRLILTATNTYTGPTQITGGVLQVAADNNLGDTGANSAVQLAGGTLNATASFGTTRAVEISSDGGTIDTNNAATLTLNGLVSGAGALTKAGAGTLEMTQDNTYAGAITVHDGTLQLGVGGASGSIASNAVTLSAATSLLAFNRSDTHVFGGVVSGAGALQQIGTGTTVLTGDSSYTGGTTITQGALQLGDGGTTGSITGDVTNNGALVFNRSDNVTFDGVISGTGSVTQNGGGITTLTGNNNYQGATTVNSGWLYVNGTQSGNGTLTANSGTRLAGDGTYGGNVVIGAGATIGAGAVPLTPATLTIGGSLTLDPNATLLYNLTQANVAGGQLNDLLQVNGDLTLGGTIHIIDEGQTFDPGVYRIINYTGALNNPTGLTVGNLVDAPATPADSLTLKSSLAGTFTVQTAIDYQVNLINTTGLTLNYWDGDAGPKNDGAIDGGNGFWRHAGPSATFNWTDATGDTNAPWADGEFAIFTAAPGTVKVTNDSGAVNTSGMQFMVNGYTVVNDTASDKLTLVDSAGTPGFAVIRVGDGTSAGTAMTATIDAELTGTVGLRKTDQGTLVLNGVNTYTGPTAIAGGTLQISDDTNLGDSAGTLTIANDGKLHTTADMTTNRAVILDGTKGGATETIVVDAATQLTVTGVVSQNTANALLTKAGDGTLILSNDNTYTGLTTVKGGTLQVGGGGTTGSIMSSLIDVKAGTALAFERSDAYVFGGSVLGAGKLQQTGAGTTILTGISIYTGGTDVTQGVLQIGNAGTTGSIIGNVAVSGGAALAFNRSNTITFGGVVSGNGALQQIGAGTTILTGANLYTGGTTITQGTLQIGNGGTTGSIVGYVTNDGALTFNRADTITFAGVVDGGGTLNQIGAGTTILTGNSTYTGNTTITQGALQLGDGGTTGEIVGNIVNSAQLVVNRNNTVTLPGQIFGTGSLTQQGTGTTILTANNTYSGGTTINNGILQLGDGGSTGNVFGDILINNAAATLALNRSNLLSVVGNISGTGNLIQQGAGDAVLFGANSYQGTTTVASGGLYINGDQSAATGATTVQSGATLGGIGIIGGSVALNAGAALAPGDVDAAPGTLTINGNLVPNAGANFNYQFGEANVVGGAFNDLTIVQGNLTLDGTLNVDTSPGGTFDVGLYRIFSYTGNLTNNTLELGTLPGSPVDYFVQTAIDKQVNLAYTAGLTLTFWDATQHDNNVVNGGDGLWQQVGTLNDWTNQLGTPNAGWTDGAFAIFSATPGTVNIDNSTGQVRAGGMQFASNGYLLSGDPLELVPLDGSGTDAIIRVGDGSSLGADYTATIDAVLTGNARLVKSDLGTLVLTATNTYTGSTTIRGGTLRIDHDRNLGQSGTDVVLENGTLQTTATFATARPFTVNAPAGTINTATGTTLTLGGAFSGAGDFIKAGDGTLVFNGDGSGYSGFATLRAGTMAVDGVLGGALSQLQVEAGARLEGNGQVANLINAGTAAPGRSIGTLTVNGNYQGNGGTLEIETVLGGDNSSTDKLIVTGDTLPGNTNVVVINRGGLGAQTQEGIKIVDIVGASNGTFTLESDYLFKGDPAVVAGAYSYRLYENGISTPSDGDWYLRSELTDSGPLYQPGTPV